MLTADGLSCRMKGVVRLDAVMRITDPDWDGPRYCLAQDYVGWIERFGLADFTGWDVDLSGTVTDNEGKIAAEIVDAEAIVVTLNAIAS